LNDDKKHVFFDQVKELHESYKVPGGLAAYIENARKLLKSASDGENPLEGWTPEVPTGITLEPLSAEYNSYESQGLKEVGKCGFVLVAGGMGERLGYNGIKVQLPTQTTTGNSYLEHYCRQILTMQRKHAQAGMMLPLAIMVSEDTGSKTVKLLESNDYFGLKKEQVTIMVQGKVPALMTNSGEIAALGPYIIDAKPHGHGDVHSLMHSTGTASKWYNMGIKWCVFFQDTNGLAFITLPAMIGVSISLSLHVNSLAVPRFAKQAVGGIAKLIHKDGRQMTVNVEYNQLDPLLRATSSPAGDVNDKATGMSIFPGNINHLLFSMEPYISTLNASHGAISEFVNPKYSDITKSTFKKPTRLECMMQDYPKLLGPEIKVGFTLAPAWACYSPCKNNPQDAAISAAAGVPAGSAYQAECDIYFSASQLMRGLGVDIASASQKAFLGITACPGPCIVISPMTAIFPSDFRRIFPSPNKVQSSARSTLIVDGDVVIRSLRLDGALKVEAKEGTGLLVRAGGGVSSVIRNKGYTYKEFNGKELADSKEVIKMRGYEISKVEERFVSCPVPVRSKGQAMNQFVFTGGACLVPKAEYEPLDDNDDDIVGTSDTQCFQPCTIA
jgi:UDP-sugar pyrophosphorylase